MSSDKMQWTKPQLIVLARGTPQESVLTVCKVIGVGIAGAVLQSQNDCNLDTSANCGACLDRSGGAS